VVPVLFSLRARAPTKLLWRMWSPRWPFDDTTFERSAAAFDNPDFVDVVIHSYRHRSGLVPGDPAVAHIETRLVAQPPIPVPTSTIDGVNSGTAHHAAKFTGPHQHRVFKDAGHNPPQERPAEWVRAVLDARAMAGAT
jgi:pimeloyl-ACP methyl ester carboxylesterase